MTTVLLNLLSSLALAVSGSLTAVVYVNILTQPGMILAAWAGWLHRRAESHIKSEREFAQWEYDYCGADVDASEQEEKARRRVDFWLKPILTCIYCVSGQLCFWLSFYVFWRYDNTVHIIFPLLTAGIGIYLAGLFQRVQQTLFPL